MTRARKEQVCLDATPYYHCICRCVRRAFLCGDDPMSGHNFDHRKQWVVDKIAALSKVFAIDICAYAIMSNHYHLVLKVNKDIAEAWSDEEVAMRWKCLFSGHVLVDRWLGNTQITQPEKDKAIELVQIWRARLYDLGWYMRCLNENIAVEANKEDNCKGRFWEGRFKSQALLDETALLACMTYVDLNPMRAELTDTPENSDFTSIQLRLKAIASAKKIEDIQPSSLSPFFGYQAHTDKIDGLPFKLLDYIELVEWSGKNIIAAKRAVIPNNIASIFERFSINPSDWLNTVKEFNRHFISAAGSDANLLKWALRTKRRWCATHQSLKLYQ